MKLPRKHQTTLLTRAARELSRALTCTSIPDETKDRIESALYQIIRILRGIGEKNTTIVPVVDRAMPLSTNQAIESIIRAHHALSVLDSFGGVDPRFNDHLEWVHDMIGRAVEPTYDGVKV